MTAANAMETMIEPLDETEEAALLAGVDETALAQFVPPQGVVWKHTWKDAASYSKPGDAKPVGILRRGKNYFHGQRDWKVRVTVRDGNRTYTNTWWAQTDDDRGNKRVWVSCVYITDGENDRAVPGLKQI